MTASATGSVAELSISADTGEIRRASAWLEKVGREQGVPADPISRLDLCLNETLANIIAHGGPEARSSPIRLELQARIEPGTREAVLTISDSGVAFDPLAHKPSRAPKTLSETEPGGLGIVMMHGYSDAIQYRYECGRNRLAFKVVWADSGQPG